MQAGTLHDADVPTSSPKRNGASTSAARSVADKLRWKALQPWDIAALVAFRVLFGCVMLWSVVRFALYGWIDRFFFQPTFFFKYWGFEWLQVPPEWALYLLHGVLAAAALGVILGCFYRLCAVTFFVGFTYIELLDVTNYLNHYYLVSLLTLLLVIVPAHRAYSIDAWRRPKIRATQLPAGYTGLLRFQIAVVYVFAGLAKLGHDWLIHAQPLNIWMTARTDFPLIGLWLQEPTVAYLMSWAGFLIDTTIVIWLSWSRTRPWAYLVLLGFHGMTSMLFNIGMFPVIMVTAALVFFSPSWPRRVGALLQRTFQSIRGAQGKKLLAGHPEPTPHPLKNAATRDRWPLTHKLVFAAALGFAIVQIAVPLRHYAYPNQVLWAEQGMRWSWKVMVREKNGSISYRVKLPEGREMLVSPSRYLTAHQEREMSGQPDLILQLAQHIAQDFRRRGFGNVEVYADALVSLNGRPAQRLIDPTANLAQISDGVGAASYVLAGPQQPPPLLRPRG